MLPSWNPHKVDEKVEGRVPSGEDAVKGSDISKQGWGYLMLKTLPVGPTL